MLTTRFTSVSCVDLLTRATLRDIVFTLGIPSYFWLSPVNRNCFLSNNSFHAVFCLEKLPVRVGLRASDLDRLTAGLKSLSSNRFKTALVIMESWWSLSVRSW